VHYFVFCSSENGRHKFIVDFAGVLRAMQTYLCAARLPHVLTRGNVYLLCCCCIHVFVCRLPHRTYWWWLL